LSGHCRLEVAKDLKLEAVPARLITGLTEAMKRAYVIADNRLALLASWDKTMLRSELMLIVEENIDIAHVYRKVSMRVAPDLAAAVRAADRRWLTYRHRTRADQMQRNA
jgi:hypothetical protein